MIFVVQGRVHIFDIGAFVKHAFVKPVIFAVFLTAFLAKSADIAESDAERLRTASAAAADPALAVTALCAMVAVFIASSVFLKAFAADLAVLLTVRA